MLGIMLGCIFITYEELNMIHIVGYLTVNMLFIIMKHSHVTILFLRNPSLVRIIGDLWDI